MIGMNSYLDAYVDRRMKFIVDEWELSTGSDLADIRGRLESLEQEIPRLKASGHAASKKLSELENRAAKLKGRI